jgi:hypothetical protein
MSDIEGKAARVAASECGQRVSFKITKKTKIDLNQLRESFVPLVAFCSTYDLQPAPAVAMLWRGKPLPLQPLLQRFFELLTDDAAVPQSRDRWHR